MAYGISDENLLYGLANVLPPEQRRLTAAALCRLAAYGFRTLEEVEHTPDWELLAIRGFGLGRLVAIRQLIDPEWQLPSLQSLKSAGQLLSAAQLALRFWTLDELEAVLKGKELAYEGDYQAEAWLSMNAFADAARTASRHHSPEVLSQIVRHAARQWTEKWQDREDL